VAQVTRNLVEAPVTALSASICKAMEGFLELYELLEIV